MPRKSFSLPYPRTEIVTEVFLGKPADLSSQAAPNFHVGPCLTRRSNIFLLAAEWHRAVMFRTDFIR